MTTARRRDLASGQSKPLPARHESSTLFFRPLRSVDMDLVLRSWFSYKNLRTFARHARMTDFLEGESHCPDPMMIECMKLGHSDLDTAADCKVQPLGNLQGADYKPGREERLLLA